MRTLKFETIVFFNWLDTGTGGYWGTSTTTLSGIAVLTLKFIFFYCCCFYLFIHLIIYLFIFMQVLTCLIKLI